MDLRLAVVDAVVARGMAKDPGERYATAGELARAATDALAHVSPVPAPTLVEPIRRGRRRWVIGGAVVLAVVLAARLVGS